MRKLLFVALAVTLGFVGMAHAVCDSRTTTCYSAIDVSGNATVGSLTNTGTSNVTGALTASGRIILTPTTQTAVSTSTVITPIVPYLILVSTGGAVTLPASALSTTATSGTYLILGSTTTNTITLSDGTGLQLGASTRALDGLKRITLIFDGLDSQWKELSYASN